MGGQANTLSNLELLNPHQKASRRRYCIAETHTLKKHNDKPIQITVKLQPSWTRCQIGLLKFSNWQFEGAENIKFDYADMQGGLKNILNTRIRNKPILKFKTKMEVMKILNLGDCLGEDAYKGIYEEWTSYFIFITT